MSNGYQKILSLSVPIMAGMVSQNILNLVDTLMIGTLGTLSLSGSGIGSFLFYVFFIGFIGISAGVQTMVARYIGENKPMQCSPPLILGLGVAIIFTGAFTLGTDECLSSKAHNQFVQAEKRKGQWEFKHDRAGKIKEMVKIFEMKGVDHADAEIIINKMAKHENFFISLMVTEGLGLQ